MTTHYQCLKQESINCCCVLHLCFPYGCIPQYLSSDIWVRKNPMLLQKMYGDPKADFTYSCQGRDTTNSNKLTCSQLCSFCSQELSYYINRSYCSLFLIYSFLCFMPPKNECPGLLLSLLWWTLSVTPPSLLLKSTSSFHTTGICLGLLPSLSALLYSSILSFSELHAKLSLLPLLQWRPSPSKAHSWVKAETRK